MAIFFTLWYVHQVNRYEHEDGALKMDDPPNETPKKTHLLAKITKKDHKIKRNCSDLA